MADPRWPVKWRHLTSYDVITNKNWCQWTCTSEGNKTCATVSLAWKMKKTGTMSELRTWMKWKGIAENVVKKQHSMWTGVNEIAHFDWWQSVNNYKVYKANTFTQCKVTFKEWETVTGNWKYDFPRGYNNQSQALWFYKKFNIYARPLALYFSNSLLNWYPKQLFKRSTVTHTLALFTQTLVVHASDDTYTATEMAVAVILVNLWGPPYGVRFPGILWAAPQMSGHGDWRAERAESWTLWWLSLFS